MTWPCKIPVTVLTGYLGAGKTTLLNRILTEDHALKIAVIVNEFGEIGIDNQLVIGADEQIFEMNNGCICCTVRGDLIRIVGDLISRNEHFDHLLIETTGLADPGPVIQSFFVDDVLASKMQLDAVVTVVDAKHVVAHWDCNEVQEQIAFADVILINKVDLISPHDLEQLKKNVRRLNSIARIHCTKYCDANLTSVLGIQAFDLKNALAIEPQFLEEDAHAHDQSVRCVAINASAPVDSVRFNRWLNQVVQKHGQSIFRLKGILDLDAQARRFVVQGVHMTLDGRPGKAWKSNEPRRSELVFIGRDLDESRLRAGFLSCLATAGY